MTYTYTNLHALVADIECTVFSGLLCHHYHHHHHQSLSSYDPHQVRPAWSYPVSLAPGAYFRWTWLSSLRIFVTHSYMTLHTTTLPVRAWLTQPSLQAYIILPLSLPGAWIFWTIWIFCIVDNICPPMRISCWSSLHLIILSIPLCPPWLAFFRTQSLPRFNVSIRQSLLVHKW